MTTPVNILLDNQSVLDDIDSCSITHTEGATSVSVQVSFKSQKFWKQGDPSTKFGELRLLVAIGSNTYSFLVEERKTSVSSSGAGFSVWGRSAQALLSAPYSEKIYDTEDTEHLWQIANASASVIAANVVTHFCPYSVTVTWGAHDFMVYKDTFSMSGQSPLQALAALAGVIGAELQANVDGSLSIVPYSVVEEVVVRSYNDIDEIVELNEQISYPSGVDAVTVYGYDESANDTAAWIQVVAATEDRGAEERGSIYVKSYCFGGGSCSSIRGAEVDISEEPICPGREHLVDVYFYDSENQLPISYFRDGDCSSKVDDIEQITEEVVLTWGVGSTRKPDLKGKTEVIGDATIPYDTTEVSYSCKFMQFSIIAPDEIGDYTIMFYLPDKSAYTTYNFTVVAKTPGSEAGEVDWGFCSSIVVDRESPETITQGAEVIFRWYGLYAPQSGKNSAGGSVTKWSGGSDRYEEDVTFSNGRVKLTYPVGSSYYKPSLTGIGAGVHIPQPSFEYGSNLLLIESWVDNADRYSVMCHVSYRTDFRRFKMTVPTSWINDSLAVWWSPSECSPKALTLPIDLSVEAVEDVPVTVTAEDHGTGLVMPGVAVTLDGVYQGNTDAAGEYILSIKGTGEHVVKLDKSGYVSSEESVTWVVMSLRC